MVNNPSKITASSSGATSRFANNEITGNVPKYQAKNGITASCAANVAAIAWATGFGKPLLSHCSKIGCRYNSPAVQPTDS